MDAATIEHWIKNLGRSYDALVADGVVPSQPLQELYEGRERVCIEPEPGLELSFWAETRRFETLFITLFKTTPSTVEYKGELPKPFSPVMAKTGVHATFGEPMASKGPVKMPQPMGMTGGWDAYRLDPGTYPNTKVIFKYTSALMVDTLVFTLIDKGHD
ncbi:hypothetical protein BZL41_23765 [Pseudomonas sp. PIC25]|uniref:DUF6392 family protein n=1 Tax=Pseudomonas sp. PIC25 TaxID=1958773 RepID=UPI000BABF61F|nr:DUF6392 family protein [Pseudomonas sp. PIC25]PAU53186.1 hypothetical protein BZL41_23765 [Pseudomonas sp. PIC25]